MVAIGLFWLASALPPAMLLSFMELGWWMGHGFELLGMLIVGVPVALDLRHKAQSRPLVGDVTGADLVAGEEAFLGAHVRALTLSLARKDEYTEEHTRRVALRAVQVGEELGLTGSRLRALATGALVHDIGKLSVPDSILQKPGPLTDEEFGIIKLHPEWGDKILVDLGFGDEVRHLVRDHHERLDGSGYPHGTESSLISFDARILGVCDVYDALISRRVALRAVQVGEVLGLTGGRLRALATGALVHDIGKLSVPDAILRKPGPLTDEEFEVIKQHPEWGDRMLVDLGFGEEVRHLVRSHHERLDGSGYPHGAEGSLISFDARILAVCDVYDALISTRVYRDAWTHERAVKLLRDESGTSFDGKCVTALERVLASERAPVAAAV